MEMLWLTEAPLVTGWEEWQLSNQENKSTMISLAQTTLSQLSVLKCCSMLKPLFMRIDASQPKNWHWVFQSGKEALVASFKILDIPRCVQNGFLTVKHNTDSKAIFSVLLAHFEADGETLSWTVTADETLVQCFEPETKKSTCGMAPSSVFLEDKIQKVSVSRQGSVMTTVFWDCKWVLLVDVVSRGRRSTPMLPTSGHRLNTKCCKWVQPIECNRNLVSAWQCKAAHKF